jgi:hypothetical protein
MGIDKLLFFGFNFIFFVCLILIYRLNKKIAIINFLTFLTYTLSSVFYLSYANFDGKGGSTFVFVFLLLIFSCIHFLGLVTYLFLKSPKFHKNGLFKIKYLLLLLLGFAVIVIGSLFRISHWPWGNSILITGILSISVILFKLIVKTIR